VTWLNVRIWWIFGSIMVVVFFKTACVTDINRDFFAQMISTNDELSAYCSKDSSYQTQIIYTQIDRDSANNPSFTTYSYGVDNERYFYPASTVKMPAAIIALEKLNELGLSAEVAYRHLKDRPLQTERLVDSTAYGNLASVAHDIKQIFLYSDNYAFNRLYEFLGQKEINERLTAVGINDSRIIHRLSVSGFDRTENQWLNPVEFYENSEILKSLPGRKSTFDNYKKKNNEKQGVGFQKNGGLIKEPFDFSEKNFYGLSAMHETLKRIIFPKSYPSAQRFNLSKKDYDLLHRVLSEYPSESLYPAPSESDGYVKFFMYGGEGNNLPKHIRIFNKVGIAYGYVTDVAYIIDLEKNIEFMISATIYTNRDQIFNNDNYEYENEAFQFFKILGKELYNFEINRSRKYTPDLSHFKNLKYD